MYLVVFAVTGVLFFEKRDISEKVELNMKVGIY